MEIVARYEVYPIMVHVFNNGSVNIYGIGKVSQLTKTKLEHLISKIIKGERKADD